MSQLQRNILDILYVLFLSANLKKRPKPKMNLSYCQKYSKSAAENSAQQKHGLLLFSSFYIFQLIKLQSVGKIASSQYKQREQGRFAFERYLAGSSSSPPTTSLYMSNDGTGARRKTDFTAALQNTKRTSATTAGDFHT